MKIKKCFIHLPKSIPGFVRPDIFMIIFLFIFTSFSHAQGYLNLRSFEKLNSYPATSFYDIAQDDYGYIWLATKNGLIKFDGSKFETASIPIGDGRSLPMEAFDKVYKDSRGNIWGGTFSGGLYRINTAKNKAVHYAASKTKKNALPDSRIKKLFEDPEGRLWVGCHKEGFCQYRSETEDFICYKPSVILQQQSIERFLDDVLSFHYQNDALWIGTLKGLLRFDPVTEELEHIDYTTNLQNPKAIQVAFNGVRDMVKLNEQEILFHAYAGAKVIFVYNMLDNKTRVVSLKSNLDEPRGGSSVFKMDNDIYYLANSKIGKINTKNLTVNWLYNTSAFANKTFKINHFFKTKNGEIWAWSKNELYLLNKPLFDKKEIGLSGNSDFVFELNEKELLFLEAEEKSIGRYNLETKTTTINKYQLSGHAKNNIRIKKIFRGKDGTIYGHTDGNIYRLNKSKNDFEIVWKYPDYFNQGSSESIMSGYLDRQGNYWLGTKTNGILKVDLKNNKTVNFKNEPEKGVVTIVYNGYPKGFFQDDNDYVWYGTDVGFGYYSLLQNKFINFPFSEYSTDDSAFPMKGIAHIQKDHQNRIWLAEQHHGLAYFNASENNPELKIISQADGLWDDHIQDMALDENGDLWVSHWKGLSRIRASNLVIENFGFESGFTFSAELFPFSDGSLGVLSSGHLQKIWPDKIKQIAISLTISIKNFKVFDHSLDLGENWNEINQVALSYQQNFFSIYFDAINFSNKEMQEVQYQMEGLHNKWISASGRDYVSFANMEGGDYQFKLRAKLKGQEWTAPKILQLHISTPYWKAAWFYGLLALLVGGIIFAAHNYRIKKIKEKEILKSQFKTQLAEVEMTALRAQMNPHFLFNCLNSIKLFIVDKDTKSASDYLTKFSKLIRLILQNSKNKTICLSDELEALELYIELEKMRFDDQFEYEINIAPGLEIAHLKIPPLLIQPYVENAIWHGLVHPDRQNKLSISLTQEQDRLRCIVEDNGVGRAAAEKRKTNRNTYKKSIGATITKNRIDLTRELYQVETSIDFIDLVDENGEATGTKVVLSIPLL